MFKFRYSLIALALLHAPGHAQSDRASHGSRLSAFGASAVIEGSAGVLAAGPTLVVESVRHSADGLVLVVRRSADAATLSLALGSQAAGGASLAVGQTITVTSTAAGLLLSRAGRLIAWLPNEVGRSLVYEQRLSGG